MTVEFCLEPQAWRRLSGGLAAWWDLIDLGVEVDGRRRIRARMDSAPRAAAELVGFADSVEVCSPPEVREELAALGRRLVTRYSAIADEPADTRTVP